jgi:hypothetical protein
MFIPALGFSAFAQAETSAKGHGIVSVFYSRNTSDERFDFNGDRTRLTPTGGGDLTTDLFTIQSAYGVTDRLEVEVLIPVVLNSEVQTVGISSSNLLERRQADASGIANARFNVRYNLVREPFFLTARFGVKTRANSTDLQRTQSPILTPIDEGTTDYELAGQLSRQFGRVKIGGEAGVRFRGDQDDAVIDADVTSRRRVTISPANEFIYRFQASYSLSRRFAVSLLGDGTVQGDYDAPFRTIVVGDDFRIRTVGTQNAPPNVTPDFRRQTGRRLLKLGPFASFSVTPRTVITGGVQFAADGRNAPTGSFFSIGISRFF